MNLERILTTLAAAAIVAIAGLYTLGEPTQLFAFTAHLATASTSSVPAALAEKGQREMLADRQMLANYQATMPFYSISLQQVSSAERGPGDPLADRQMLANYQAQLPIYEIGVEGTAQVRGSAE